MPGATLVGERTRRTVAGFRFDAEERLEIKGKHESIAAAALLERLEPSGGVRERPSSDATTTSRSSI